MIISVEHIWDKCFEMLEKITRLGKKIQKNSQSEMDKWGRWVGKE